MAANNSEKQILGATNSTTYCIKNYKIYLMFIVHLAIVQPD